MYTKYKLLIFSSPEPLPVCQFVCLSVCMSTLSNINIFATRGTIAIKFYLKHYCGGVKAALGFGSDRIRTPVSIVTDSPIGL